METLKRKVERERMIETKKRKRLRTKNMELHGLPRRLSGKETTSQCRRHRFDSWIGKIPWSRKWQPTPIFLPGESHGERSLADYSPWDHKRVGPNLVPTPPAPAPPSVQFTSVAQSCPTICKPVDCSTPGLPVHH